MALLVVDQLHINVLVGSEHAKTRALSDAFHP
jgi:hypothetical protein